MCPTLLPSFASVVASFPSKALMGAQREETVPALPNPPGPFLCLQTFQAMASAKVCGRSGLSISQSPMRACRIAA
jgi:hypothetical protein